ncbi:MAG: DNA-methyltransferase [Candidatus Helarchaeota archaeon]
MKKKERKRGTRTSSFGSPGRISHDSSEFYASKLYEGSKPPKKIEYIENEMPSSLLNRILCKSSEKMGDIPDNSVHLMITSPPYNVGKDYDRNYTLSEYLQFLKSVWTETKRVLVPGGRACINVANLGRKPYIPLDSFIAKDMLDLGFLMRGEIIWDKGSSAGSSTAWGSWCSASNPTLRDVHEYILVFCKDTFKRINLDKRNNSIQRDEFLEYTKSIWKFQAESAYTFEKEIVLDPFMGSGQTAIAAIKSNRYYVGYEIDKTYADLAMKRVRAFRAEFNSPKLADFLNE